MATKITKRDYYNQLLAVEEVASNEKLVEFINHELELLDRKRSNGGRSQRVIEEQWTVQEYIMDALKDNDKYMTVTEICNYLDNEYSNQKVSAMLKKLVESNVVAKITEKGKSLFKVVV